VEQADPVHVALAEADDAAGADGDAGLSDALDRVQPVLVLPGRRDLFVVLWRRVEVVVVRRQALYIYIVDMVVGE
jgi:hypothetical protein